MFNKFAEIACYCLLVIGFCVFISFPLMLSGCKDNSVFMYSVKNESVSTDKTTEVNRQQLNS
jgi:hypothetical protein